MRGVNMRLGGDYSFADEKDAFEVWSVGAEVEMHGFTLAAHYEDDKAVDAQDIALGAGYGMGPWTFTAGWAHTDAAATDFDTYSGWATYAIAPGVDASAGIQYATDGDDDAYAAMSYVSVAF